MLGESTKSKQKKKMHFFNYNDKCIINLINTYSLGIKYESIIKAPGSSFELTGLYRRHLKRVCWYVNNDSCNVYKIVVSKYTFSKIFVGLLYCYQKVSVYYIVNIKPMVNISWIMESNKNKTLLLLGK